MTCGPDREAIVQALFEHIRFRVPDFKTTGRRVKSWTDQSPQPAFYLRHIADEDESAWDPLQLNSIEVEAWIYSEAGKDPDAQPDTELNDLVRQVREAMAPDDDDRQVFTLSGKVWACGIKGRSEFDPGDLDGYSKAVIPIKILLP